jgi:hypothetical protein
VFLDSREACFMSMNLVSFNSYPIATDGNIVSYKTHELCDFHHLIQSYSQSVVFYIALAFDQTGCKLLQTTVARKPSSL